MRTVEEIKSVLDKVIRDERETSKLLEETTRMIKLLTAIDMEKKLKDKIVKMGKEGIETSMALNIMRGTISGLKWVLEQESALDIILEARDTFISDDGCDTCADRFDCDIIKEKQTIH